MFKSIPFIIFFLYLVMSIITFIVYKIDKSSAQNGTWRISEKTLHFLSMLGGWPGAFYAQQFLRHKSKKTEFKIIFYFTVFINILITYLFTDKILKIFN